MLPTNVTELPSGPRPPAESARIAAARRALARAKDDKTRAAAEDAETWTRFCILRAELEKLERALANARAELARVQQREPSRVPTGDLLADARAAKAFSEARAQDIERASAAIESVNAELEPRRRQMMKLEAERRAIATRASSSVSALERAQCELDAARLVEALEGAAPLLGELLGRCPPAQFLELLRAAIEPPPPPPALAA